MNVKAEMEIAELHEKLDLPREAQWNQLVEMQQRQIELLEQQTEILQGFSETEPPYARPKRPAAATSQEHQ